MKITGVILILIFTNITLNAQWARAGFEGDRILAFHFYNNSLLAYNRGYMYRSINNGISWDSISSLDVVSMDDMCSKGDTLFACGGWACTDFCTPSPCIFRSFDGGFTWENIFTAMLGAYHIVLCNNSVFCNVNGDLLRSTDFGTSWDTLPNPHGPYSFQSLYSYNNVLYSTGNGLNRSIDNGENWSKFSNGLPGASDITAIDTSIFVSVNNSIYVSSIFMDNWHELNPGNLPLLSIYYITSSDSILFITGTINGINNGVKVYSRNINADEWTDISGNLSGPTFDYVTFISTNDRYLFLGKEDGIWRYDLSEPMKVPEQNNIPANYILYQNYPNPFNPTTKIKYTIPSNVKSEMSNVKLMIYDVLGDEVATLVNEEKPAGEYEIEFDGSRLACGVYFYNLIAGGKRLTGKMNLIK